MSSFKNSAQYLFSRNDWGHQAAQAAIFGLLALAAYEVGILNVNPIAMTAGSLIGCRLNDARSPRIRYGITHSCY
jgi:hypothetical protein